MDSLKNTLVATLGLLNSSCSLPFTCGNNSTFKPISEQIYRLFFTRLGVGQISLSNCKISLISQRSAIYINDVFVTIILNVVPRLWSQK